MHRFAILAALFIIFGCTVPKAAKAAAPATAAPAPESVSAKIVDRGAETSRTIDEAGTPKLNSADPAIHAWELSVIEKLKPYMRWPDDAPYWIDSAAVVRVTIDRQGLVLRARVVRGSGYEAFDRAARKVFKRAAVLPPPPPALTGAAASFDMAVTFAQ